MIILLKAELEIPITTGNALIGLRDDREKAQNGPEDS